MVGCFFADGLFGDPKANVRKIFKGSTCRQVCVISRSLLATLLPASALRAP